MNNKLIGRTKEQEILTMRQEIYTMVSGQVMLASFDCFEVRFSIFMFRPQSFLGDACG